MTMGATQIGVIERPVRPRFSYVLAAVDRTSVSAAVRLVGKQMARHLDVPLREVHITGTSPPGATLRSKVAKIESAKASKVTGHPTAVLTALIASSSAPLAVLGMPSTKRRPSQRMSGTTFSVARQVTRPLLVVPRGLTTWNGPRHILVPLNGTSTTAYAASLAIAELNLSAMTTTPVHVFHEDTVPSFWDQPHHAYEAWTKEFQARYVDEVIEDGFEVRAGPATPGEQLVEAATQGAFDLVVVVWSQLAPGTKTRAVVRLLAECPVPILLVPASFGAPTPSKS
jgi:Universal stress protein family